MERVAELVRDLRQDDHHIDFVDAGGGLGISYDKSSPADFPAQVEAYAHSVTTPLRDLKVRLLLEPGRSIVGPAGVLLTSVIYKKANDGKRFLVVDAAMNDLIRPALYSAYHEILPVRRNNSGKIRADVVGPVCETGDFLARDREMPEVMPGDVLAVCTAGAYGFVQASTYNARRRPAEVMVKGDRWRVVRERETYEDLIRGELG